MKTADFCRDFAQTLVDWFLQYGRDYPWRRTTDPWAILVSEVMLQQTTIPTVLARYESWMQRYPTPSHLAQASEQDALLSWEGLGYYRRVRALQAAARAVCEQYDGVFPQSESELRALPGIGDYTAAAVLSFAYNKPAPLVDANVARVLARIYNDPTPIDSTAGRKNMAQRAAVLVHRSNPRAYNSALMELGQSICIPGRPNCLICPVRPFCHAQHPEILPVKAAKRQITTMEHWDIWQLTPHGLLMEQQPTTARHAGMYRLPRRRRELAQSLPHICDQTYAITRYKVTRHLHRARGDMSPQNAEQYIPIDRLESIPMASPDRKLVLKLLTELPEQTHLDEAKKQKKLSGR